MALDDPLLVADALEIAQHSSTIGSDGFDADALQITKALHPFQHLPIALACGREILACKATILLINDPLSTNQLQILTTQHSKHHLLLRLAGIRR
ncbi:MAG: hypothetical protein AAGI03_02340 [Pseudomonadota bacterium]